MMLPFFIELLLTPLRNYQENKRREAIEERERRTVLARKEWEAREKLYRTGCYHSPTGGVCASCHLRASHYRVAPYGRASGLL